MRIESYINRGNSFPIIINKKGKRYFVKLRAGMSGQYALLNEWIGNQLGAQLKLNTQVPQWIELNEEVKMGDLYIEVKELVKKSWGLNIGFEYQEQAKEVCEAELKDMDQKIKNKLFLFDLMMLNVDRTSSNLNLMRIEDEIISVDYESSLLVQELAEERTLLDNVQILECLRSNPLYQDLRAEEVDEFIGSTQGVNIKDLFKNVPVSLLKKEDGESLIEKIEFRRTQHWFLKEILYKLRNIQPETQEEKRKRINHNQAEFIRKFKENSSPDKL